MAVWGISLLILSLTFFTYRHPPHTWRFSIQQWLKKELQDTRVEKVGDDKGRGTVRNGKEVTEEREKDVKEKGDAKEKLIPQRSEKELPRAQVEGSQDEDEDEDKTPQAKPTAPSIAVPSFTLDDPSSTSTPTFTLDEPSTFTPSFTLDEPLPPKPSFPAPNSPQRASAGNSTTSQPSTQKPSPTLMAPPSKPASQMPPPPKPSLTTPPTFPAPNSAQRASSTSLMPPPRGPAPRPSTSLMPPPRGPLPNRTPPSSAATARNPTPRIDTPSSRKKVQLAPGFSPLDWATLSRNNLSNVPTFTRVTPSMLSANNGRKGTDAWSAYRGKVYNITPYAGFHPGGKGELFRGAGKEATEMFMEVHPWVNWEGMLGNCLVGVLVPEGEGMAEEEEGLEGLD